MNRKICFANVILPLPVKGVFTYKIPADLSASAKPGMRAVVQFGQKRIYTSIIQSIHTEIPVHYKPKEILSLPDNYSVILNKQLDFWNWMSSYYLSTLGEIYKAALPAGLKPESETRFTLSGNNFENVEIKPKEKLILSLLQDKVSTNTREISKVTGLKNPLLYIHSLIEKGLIQVEERLTKFYKPKLEAFISLTPDLPERSSLIEIIEKLSKAPRQKETFESFLYLTQELTEKGKAGLKKSILLKDRLSNTHALDALIKKSILTKTYRQVSRLDTGTHDIQKLKTLSEVQKSTLSEIDNKFKTFNTVLLHGVTSSGKTEIYAHLIEKQLKSGKQILYMLPEIALTTQIIERLKKYFGKKIGVYHSKYSDAERVEVWKNLINETSENRFQIILGVRSSVFLPFKKLGLVIVDEEYENSYKQQDPAPRYHARDAAIYLAHLHNAKTLLGTATPSLESYYNVTIGKYGLVDLNVRHGDIQLPAILLANAREAWRKRQMVSHFTPELFNAISETIESNEQVILFQNRRGFSPYIQCDKCGWIPRCKHCDVNLTYHKISNALTCHYCGYNISIPGFCPDCGAPEIRTKGFGTEKIEEEVKLLFKEARVSRMDLDTTRRKRSYQKIISDLETRKTDILIGTQMISKGLDFDHVRLVGVLNADNLLFFPDFRSYERTFQLLAQVSGRAGRKGKRGKVIIQTSDPEHPILQWVVNDDYLKMFRSQLNERRNFKYPPCYRMIKITIKHRDFKMLNRAGDYLGKKLREVFGKYVLGPEFPLISRVQRWHLKTILLKLERGKQVAKAKDTLQSVIIDIENMKEFRALQIIVDVDPM